MYQMLQWYLMSTYPWIYAEYSTQTPLMTYTVSVIWKISFFVNNHLKALSLQLWFDITPCILINKLVKLKLYISFMWIHLVPITRARDSVALIPWNLTSHQRHFHWLYSRLSMWYSYQMDDIELRTAILPEFYGLQLKRRWYFEGELPDGSAMSKITW